MVIRDYQQGELVYRIHAVRVLSYEQQTEIDDFIITSLSKEDPYEGTGTWLLSQSNVFNFRNVTYQAPTISLIMQDGLLDLTENYLTTTSPITIEQNDLTIQATSLTWHLNKKEMFFTHVDGEHRELLP